jgi:hypothetical protein
MNSAHDRQRACHHCGQFHPAGASFCPVTGAQLIAEVKPGHLVCPTCGSQVEASWKFCVRCQTALNQEPGPAIPRRYGRFRWWLAGLILAALILVLTIFFVLRTGYWSLKPTPGRPAVQVANQARIPATREAPADNQRSSLTPSMTATRLITKAGQADLPTPTKTTTLRPTITQTITVTQTSGSTPTFPSNSLVRSGAPVFATFLSHPPVIDGSLDDWDQTPFRITAVTYGQEHFTGAEDISSMAMVAWDEQFLYLGLRIVDDRYVQVASGNTLYKGDSIEVMIDTDLSSDFNDSKTDTDDYHLGMSLGADLNSPANYLWQPTTHEGVVEGLSLAGDRVYDGYILEAAVPWKGFHLTPTSGAVYGFCLSVSDNDQAGARVQETMVSSAANRELYNPTSWGNLYIIRP